MPQVPKLPTVSPVADQTPYQSGQAATANVFGASKAEALGSLGNDLQKTSNSVADIVNQLQQEKNATDFNEGKLAFGSGLDTLFYGNGSADNPGFYGLSGKDALQAAPSVAQKIRELKSNIIGKYNPAVQRELEKALGASEQDAAGKMAERVQQQRKVYDQTLSDASKQQAIADAARGYADPAVLQKSEATAIVMAGEDAKRAGIAGTQADAYNRQVAVTNVYQAAIMGAINDGDITTARALYNDYNTKMLGPVAAQVHHLLTTSENIKQAQTETDRIMNDPKLDTAEKKLDAARNLSKDPSGEVRKLVEPAVEHRLALEETLKARNLTGVYEEAAQTVSTGTSLNEWAKKNPAKYLLLTSDPTKLKEIQAAETAIAHNRVYATVPNPALETEIMGMKQEDLAKMSPARLSMLSHSMTEAQYTRVTTAYKAAVEAGDKNSKSYAPYHQAYEILKDTAPTEFGFKEKSPDNKQIDRQNAAINQMNSWIYTNYSSQGKVPTYQEMSDYAKTLTIPVEKTFAGVDWHWTNRYSAQLQGMTPDEKSKFSVRIEDVPDNLKAQVKQAFIDRGRQSPTDEQIQNFLGAEIAQDKQRQLQLILDAPVAADRPPPKPYNERTDLGATKSFINASEGRVNTVYKDTKGNPTIGVGFNLNRPDAQQRLAAVGANFQKILSGENTLSDAQIETLFNGDVLDAEQAASSYFPNFTALSHTRQAAIIDMIYNMGPDIFGDFKNTIDAINSGDFEKAAQSILNSQYARDVPNRAKRNAEMIRKGK